MKNVFIIGSKGIPAQYGGFETFVENLTSFDNGNIKYHVACLAEDSTEFTYHGAHCFNVSVPPIGSAKAIYYDVAALHYCVKYIEEHQLSGAIVYILACRIGPFLHHYKKELSRFNVRVLVNPDGHEWKRKKWNALVRKYWKLSERLMIKYADLAVCDSLEIEKYIQFEYRDFQPKTTYISYGSNVALSTLSDEEIERWYGKHQITSGEFYLIVGRFVPENNIELIIREFMLSNTKKDLVIITNVKHNKFYKELLKNTCFSADKRIKFVGTVYDVALLKRIREDAYAYIHGHEVGGTNPSLLEALGSTKLNLLLDVPFNREVGREAALYFNKGTGDLARLIESADEMLHEFRENYGSLAKKEIQSRYSWDFICKAYWETFERE